MPLPFTSLVCRMELRSPSMFREFCTTCWLIAKLLFLHHLLPTTCCLDLCPQTQARWVAMMFRCTPKFDECFCSFRVFEFKMCSRRSLATLLQDGPSHVHRSNRSVWQFDVQRYTTRSPITAYKCDGHLCQISGPFFVFLLGASLLSE